MQEVSLVGRHFCADTKDAAKRGRLRRFTRSKYSSSESARLSRGSTMSVFPTIEIVLCSCYRCSFLRMGSTMRRKDKEAEEEENQIPRCTYPRFSNRDETIRNASNSHGIKGDRKSNREKTPNFWPTRTRSAQFQVTSRFGAEAPKFQRRRRYRQVSRPNASNRTQMGHICAL